jgi:hypothetical protein
VDQFVVMQWLNACHAVIFGAVLALTGEGFGALSFLISHGDCALLVAALGGLSCVSQVTFFASEICCASRAYCTHPFSQIKFK